MHAKSSHCPWKLPNASACVWNHIFNKRLQLLRVFGWRWAREMRWASGCTGYQSAEAILGHVPCKNHTCRWLCLCHVLVDWFISLLTHSHVFRFVQPTYTTAAVLNLFPSNFEIWVRLADVELCFGWLLYGVEFNACRPVASKMQVKDMSKAICWLHQ